jgi:hypothetical protein
MVFQIDGTQVARLTTEGRFALGPSFTPSALLHVTAGAGTLDVLAAGQSGVSNGYVISSNGSALTHQWYNTGNEAMRLASGNLGLGVTPSAWGTNLRTIDIGFGTALTNANSTTDTWLSSNAYYTTQWLYKNAAEASYYQQASGAHKWYTAASGLANAAITFGDPKMSLDASGNLGIATASPGTRLDVVGPDGNGLQYRTATRTIGLGSIGGVNALYGGSGTEITFHIGTERARITSGGYFKASDNGTYAGPTVLYHEFSNSANEVSLLAQNTNASFSQAVLLVRSSRAAGATHNLITCQANLVEQFSVSGNGTIYAQNTTVQSLSDARLKENVRTATEGLAIINALRPVRYDWKAGHGNDRKDQLGFIAQEVEAVFADAVSEWKMGEETYKTVGPGALIPVLVNAIKELSSRVAALEA